MLSFLANENSLNYFIGLQFHDFTSFVGDNGVHTWSKPV